MWNIPEEQNEIKTSKEKVIARLGEYNLHVTNRQEQLHWTTFHNMQEHKKLSLLPHKGMMVEGGCIELIGTPGNYYLVNYDASYVKSFITACFRSVDISYVDYYDSEPYHVYDFVSELIDAKRAR